MITCDQDMKQRHPKIKIFKGVMKTFTSDDHLITKSLMKPFLAITKTALNDTLDVQTSLMIGLN